jgi:UDP-glucose 4-epimerase
MNVLITGGAGYIGCELVSRLNQLDNVNKIVVYDNLSRGQYSLFFGANPLDKVDFVQGDILDAEKLNKNLKGIDIVVHLAAFVSQPYNHLQNLQYEQINVWGTLNVVKAIQNSSSVKSALYLSSTSVYGFKNDINHNIDHPAPSNGYGISKLQGEKYFRLLKSTHNACIIHSANVFGFNNFLGIEGVVNTFMFDALVHKNIQIYGNGDQKRPFVYINNLINNIITWVVQPSEINVFAIDFNASMNELKDWLINKVEDLDFRYINQNQNFPSQSFLIKEENENINRELEKAWKDFDTLIRIKKK